MKYFVVGLIVGLAIILLSEKGFLSALLSPGAAAGAAGATGAASAAGASTAAGTSGGCGCGSSSTPVISVPAPAIPVNQTPSSPWYGGFGGNPNYEAPQFQVVSGVNAFSQLTNPSKQAY
jgi:hypothetical protein